MELDWLQTFVVAAEEQNFHRAAERLHLAQPTVTLQIQKLEQAWGIRLFDRTGRHVVLSPAGRRLLEHARGMLELHRGSMEDIARWQQGYDETIRISTSPLIATTVLPQWIRGFSRQHPNYEFSIQVSESKNIVDSLLEHQSDLGFSRMETSHPQISITRLYSDPVVMVIPTDEHDFEGPPKTVAELLAQYTVFTHNHPEYWDSLMLSLRRMYPFIRTMQVSQVHVTIHLIAEKMGVSFLPVSTVRRELLRGTIVETAIDTLQLPTAHTYLLKNRVSSEPAQKFADYIADYMRLRSG